MNGLSPRNTRGAVITKACLAESVYGLAGFYDIPGDRVHGSRAASHLSDANWWVRFNKIVGLAVTSQMGFT
jgi:hypothetical protein